MTSPESAREDGDEIGEFPPPNERGPIQSIDRAANVLALFDENVRTLTPTFVAEQLGLNRTTARRYLQALHGAGFLTAEFSPGPLIDQLSALVSIRQQLISIAPPVLRSLSDRTGLTAVMSFLGRTGAVVTLVEEATEGTILLTVRVGTVLELRAAQSRALFAFQSDPEVVLRALGALTPAEARVEQQELAKVRQAGVAWADLRRTGLESVAAPVFGIRSGVHAAIGLLGTTALLNSDPDGTERVQALRNAAEELGAILAG
ncbi:helix-turn-helix domain-containing protein [Microbacterium lushaniae]|nr:helix-turn-helix domain-containing protein [Microbacterium lushaniae]KAA9159156.1 helix-turn-helix domain-containing protein [Microbacterium lushaniae]